jgi:hypothetical protein
MASAGGTVCKIDPGDPNRGEFAWISNSGESGTRAICPAILCHRIGACVWNGRRDDRSAVVA